MQNTTQYITVEQKYRLLKVFEAARDLRNNFACTVLASEYESGESIGEILDSWDISTIPEEWPDYSAEKLDLFRKYAYRITALALRGWKSDDEDIGELEGIINETQQVYRLKKGSIFSFIDDEGAKEIYYMTKNPRYQNEDGTVKSKEIAKDYAQKTGNPLKYNYVNVIMRRYKD
ncbi:MAG: hypothetical protein ACOCQX_01570 [Candidatus Nanoarchaeia archaeon]